MNIHSVCCLLMFIPYGRADQLQPMGGPHNYLRTRLRAARVHTRAALKARESGKLN